MALVLSALIVAVPSGIARADNEPWTPANAPMPSELPNGNAPEAMTLNSTSCSSSSFCVAVGFVTDGAGNVFPVAETYDGTVWTPSVLPMPPDESTRFYVGELNSVSCAVDGACAAIGIYNSFNPELDTAYQSGLLEVLSEGVWTPSAGALPSGPDSGLVNLYGVSCSDADSCVGVGDEDDFDGLGDVGLIYTLESGSWDMQIAPLPTNDENSLTLNGISCPEDGTCVVVGSYQDATDNTYGLILVLDDGQWSAMQAPIPPNASPNPVLVPDKALFSVDCPEAGWCLAGGWYADADNGIDPLFLELEDGVWTAMEAPGESAYTEVQGVFCPAVDACVATGTYSGLLAAIWTQTDGGWSWGLAPLPGQGDAAPLGRASRDLGTRSVEPDAGSSSLAGVSCGPDAFCAAAGSDGQAGLTETASFSSLPTVDGISPALGPVSGGTLVTVVGTNFTPSSVASFGSTVASSTYVSPTELQVVAPPVESPQNLDVTVSGGGTTSRSTVRSAFSYMATVDPAATGTILSSTPDPAVAGQPLTLVATVGAVEPNAGTPTGDVAFFDGDTPLAACGGSAGTPLVATTASCNVTYPAVGSHDLTASYLGDGTFDGSTSSWPVVETVGQAATTTTLSSSANPSAVKQAVTLTAGIAVTSPGSGSPTGTISFIVNGTPIPTCTGVSVSGAVASCTTKFNQAKAYTIVASYSGDANDLASTSGSFTQSAAMPTKVKVASSAKHTSVGQPVTLSASVKGSPTAGEPTGTVSFTENGTLIPTCDEVALVGTTAVCHTSFVAPGIYAIVGAYSGDPSHLPSSSGPLKQHIVS